MKNVPDSQNFLKTSIDVTVEFRGFVIVTPSNEESKQILNQVSHLYKIVIFEQGENKSDVPYCKRFELKLMFKKK